MKEVNTTTFKQSVLNKSQKKGVVVQFYAPWCGPCRSLKPVIEKVHLESNLEWDLVFVNVKDNVALARQFNVFTVPEVKLFEKGEATAAFSGFKPDYIIRNWLERNLDQPIPSDPIELQLTQNDIQKVKEGLLGLAQKENPESDYLKLLLAVESLGTKNAQAMQWIQQIDASSPLMPLVKRIRDFIDMEVEDSSSASPTSSPFMPTSEDANSTIDIANFNHALLGNLVFYGLNEIRKRQNVPLLETESILNQAALDQNNYQIRTDFLSHYQDNPIKKTVKDRVDYFGGRFRMVGENVQYKGFPVRTWSTHSEVIAPSYVQAADEIIKNWVKSPGHYKNMIKPDYKYVGTATGWNPENNAVFATQVFGA